ncbi:family 2 glycosyl transferase [Pseudoxanthomonas kalamensis DSM 18571]|uniref:glycosyltransferase family 2 protein n=1 Tax=Pseudoxanthomonas kalamensis TaxID=289483 RepID=UPI0013915BE7|nr:glycosyltransferase family 2 protein [Pseudoxanthomonas kalamensis]KAF1708909.1 family 2 glycosyl transferase [Pseudoxanthomonas kalamensis DSM 18571]
MDADRRPAGWYAIDVGLNAPVKDGRLVIKPDYDSGDGAPSNESIVVQVDTGGVKRLQLVFPLRSPALNIEFEVDDDDGVLSDALSGFDPRPISKWKAAWQVLAGRPGRFSAAGIVGALRACWNLVHAAVVSRMSGIKDGVWRHYLDANGIIDRQELHSKLQLRRSVLGPAMMTWLVPVSQLERIVSELGGNSWKCTGNDPQFLVMGSTFRLPAGWYWFECRLLDDRRRIIAPCLFPDYGSGHIQADAIELPTPDQTGWIRGLVLLAHDVQSLRFDPTTNCTEFSLQDCRLLRISRLRALWDLLRSESEGDETDWKEIRKAFVDFLYTVRASGLQAAVQQRHDRLRARYVPGRLDYRRWVSSYDTVHGDDLDRLQKRAAGMGNGPLISVLLPVYETPERWLRQCLDSVLRQTYRNWELCIADDASSSRHVRKVLDEYAAKDDRIRVVYRDKNGHIAESSNTSLQMAQGEFVALLDHDDELQVHALASVAEVIVNDPSVRFIYSDEDKINELGERFHPNFKPDWNPDLLLSQNYLCHLAVIDTALAREAGGFRKGYEGSQDHDLFLRCTSFLHAEQIAHIPKILYHWRAIEGSTALHRDEKDYAADAGLKAVHDHMRKACPGAAVEGLPHGHYRVVWPLPSPQPKVNIVIPTRDRAGLLETCIESLLSKTKYSNFEVVVVDNGSEEPDALQYLAKLATYPKVRVLSYPYPFNFSAINNFAVRHCDGELLCLMNNDIEVVKQDWLSEMAAHALRPEIGAVGAMLYYPDGNIQHAGVILGVGGVANHAYCHSPKGYPGHGARALVAQNLSAVTAACLVIRRSVYESVGGLDERLKVAFNDVDFCLRVGEAGYRNLWTPFAELVHHESATRGADESEDRLARFHSEVRFMQERWKDVLEHDPAYNPNLALTGWGEDLAFPPRTA